MQPHIERELYGMIGELVQAPKFRELLEQFVRDKARNEKSAWAEITRSAHDMLGGTSPHIDRVCAVTELVLLGLDIMDDLQDKDNDVKPWMNCPPELALNAVMALLMGGVNEIARLRGKFPEDRLPDAGAFSEMILRSIDGQYRDLDHSVETEADYIAMVERKSGSLLQLACYMGYSCAYTPDESARTMHDLACIVGVLAQLENDLRDVQRFDLKNDLLHRKKTLPSLYLLNGDEEEFPVIRQYFDGTMEREQFLLHKKEVLHYIEQCGCVDYTRIIQSLYVDKADELLHSIPGLNPEGREKFRSVTYGKFAASAAGV